VLAAHIIVLHDNEAILIRLVFPELNRRRDSNQIADFLDCVAS
jgi:hypothetical protein